MSNERPPLWREIQEVYEQTTVSYYDDEGALCRMEPEADTWAAVIHKFATYIETHGLINTISQPTPRSGPRLLALLEEEARRAEAGE